MSITLTLTFKTESLRCVVQVSQAAAAVFYSSGCRGNILLSVPSQIKMPVVCFQANTEALGAVHPVRESAPGESGGSGPAGQAAALRPPAEADGS